MNWTERYKTEIAELFSDQQILEYQVRVEREWLSTLWSPTDDISKKEYIPTLERVKQIESRTKHDVVAMVKGLEEVMSTFSPTTYIKNYIHFGLTSQDINDTVLALQLSDSHEILIEESNIIKHKLLNLIKQNKDVICIARTHGQHAIPITMGFKFANFLLDWEYSISNLNYQREHSIKGKLSGAIGTSAPLESLVGIDSYHLERETLNRLGLSPVNISTQVVSRLYLVNYMQAVISLACQMEKIAKEIRNLQRTEIGELYEEYNSNEGQVGSSAMPQKRNPISSENICGLARIVRSQLAPLMETIALEHERDLTNSSVERVAISTIICLTHYMMKRLNGVLESLKVDSERCAINLNMLGGREMSEHIMSALIHEKHLTRTQAHELLNRNPNVSLEDKLSPYYEKGEINNRLLNHKFYLGRCHKVVDKILS